MMPAEDGRAMKPELLAVFKNDGPRLTLVEWMNRSSFDELIEIDVARYHSLAAEEASLPEVLKVIARTKDGEIMAIKHKDYDIYGLQFHPESILTPEGKKILQNFINIAERRTTK